MEVTLEGSNSAETFPPRDGVARLHRPVTGKLALWLSNYYSLLFASFFFGPYKWVLNIPSNSLRINLPLFSE
ncbi:hypothetical protein BDQ94DRAFT_134890 [Aspergillus welwitschiae]|uniref:Uncharacterized protein n=1 Tax=Aspergillus welwitschiae TaxID=1341132 RepID=A0A3F3QJ90_9EURO|nr:hypothetical protein BDQ94DRAFT_134890 [Aspergillus welwitschiae]RDH38922.1 hypothetical protein BDQ94DRAFT_134890 [Aspergillus welwitschiae]